jgi:acetyl-CoA carboxylase, biotin carboxylase subunit
LGYTAARAARAAGYVNAGTCEFLLDRDGKFYFLEMNTRIQVEHPVTELVYGLDLVQWQIRIAAGERIPSALTGGLAPRGWAIECRITSEDPSAGFLPSTGRITGLHVPGGPGVRWDGGIELGSEVGLLYDPLLAKLIVWAPTRADAIERMRRALDELVIDGVETARDFHLRVMSDEEFRSGAIDIHWLERRLPSLVNGTAPESLTRLAALTGALLANGGQRPTATPANGTAAVPASLPPASNWLALARREALH